MALFTIALLASLIWAVLLLPYVFWIRQTTFFNAQRFYLLLSLLTGLLISTITVLGQNITNFGFRDFFSGFRHLSNDNEIIQKINESLFANPVIIRLSESGWQMGVYFVICSIIFTLFIYKLFEIFLVVKGNFVEMKSGMKIVKSPQSHTPFSFFNYIFFSKEYKVSPEEEATILRHEVVHTRQRHSFDVILSEILFSVTWIFPVILFYKKYLMEIHEYIADEQVTKYMSPRKYGQMLIAHQLGEGLALSHHFSTPDLESRFKKMAQRRSNFLHTGSFLLFIPLSFICFSGAQGLDLKKILTNKIFRDAENNETSRPIDLSNQDIRIVEGSEFVDLPQAVFPGGQEALAAYLAKNVTVSNGANRINTYITLVIGPDGQINAVKYLGKVTPEFKESFDDAIAKMPTWYPAKKKGQYQSSEVTLNILF